MKRWMMMAAGLVAVVMAARGQTVPLFVVGADKEYRVEYIHALNLPVRAYVDGAAVKNFTVTDIAVVATNSVTNITFRIVMPGLDRGQHRLNLTCVEDGVESVFSEPIDLKVKPNAPRIFRIFQ